MEKKKSYCEYIFCNHPNRALPPIKQDYLWSNPKKRKMHKKCWKDWDGDPAYIVKNPLNNQKPEQPKEKIKKPTPKMEYIKSKKGEQFIVSF
jgi:hypothetical protein